LVGNRGRQGRVETQRVRQMDPLSK
jgi:hypothetical protein